MFIISIYTKVMQWGLAAWELWRGRPRETSKILAAEPPDVENHRKCSLRSPPDIENAGSEAFSRRKVLENARFETSRRRKIVEKYSLRSLKIARKCSLRSHGVERVVGKEVEE